MTYYSALPKNVHDDKCACDCWPCFYDWDKIDNEEPSKLFIACYACMGAGCNDCLARYLEGQE